MRLSQKELAESQEFRKFVRELVTTSENHLNMMERCLLLQHFLDDLLAFGPVSRIMRKDNDILEIVIVGLGKILIRKNGSEAMSSERFRDEILGAHSGGARRRCGRPSGCSLREDPASQHVCIQARDAE